MAGARELVDAPAPDVAPNRRRSVAGIGVLAASALAGLAAFAYFAVVDGALGPTARDQFAAFYSLSLLIGFGFFAPLESELARSLGQRRDVATGLREAAAAAVVVAVVVAAGLGAAAVPLLGLLGGSPWLLVATLGIVAVSALQFWVRGALLGRGRPAAFAATLAADSALRVGVALLLVLALGSPSSAAFSLSLLLPLLLAHLAFVPVVRRGLHRQPGERAAPGALLARITPLFAATLCAQVLQNAPVLVVAALVGPGEAAAFLFAFTLARVPLFMAVPVQGALVPPMAAMVVAGRLDRLVRLLLVVAGVVAAVALAGGALAAWLGPAVLEALFPRSGAVPGGDLALMVVGVAAHVGLLVTAQATVAAGHHRGAGAAWSTGLAVAVVVFTAWPALSAAGSSGGVLPRVETAFLSGSAAGWVLAVVLLVRHARAERPTPPAEPDLAAGSVRSAGPAREGAP